MTGYYECKRKYYQSVENRLMTRGMLRQQYMENLEKGPYIHEFR